MQNNERDSPLIHCHHQQERSQSYLRKLQTHPHKRQVHPCRQKRPKTVLLKSCTSTPVSDVTQPKALSNQRPGSMEHIRTSSPSVTSPIHSRGRSMDSTLENSALTFGDSIADPTLTMVSSMEGFDMSSGVGTTPDLLKSKQEGNICF